MSRYNCLVVLGPTASGKTRLACQLAYALNGEIISADSRQVYKRLNVGTGKDLGEYVINGRHIPYHGIDVAEPGGQFYLHQYMEILKTAFDAISAHGHLPIICGGTGLYLDALQKDFSYTEIKENAALRNELAPLSKEELLAQLNAFPAELTRHVDRDSEKRIIRGIETAAYRLKNKTQSTPAELPYKPCYIGIRVDVETRRQLISERLGKRLDGGLIEEVQALLASGITHERLAFLGLEYKFVSQYLQDTITKDELFSLLQTAIFQYAKRQMTWFRKMERDGVAIHWVEKNSDAAALARLLKTVFDSGC